MTLTSVGYDGTINEAEWARLSESLGSAYSVATPGAWEVSSVAATDRTIRIAIGTGSGRGVQDTLTGVAPTLQLPVQATGSRWDTIVARRDWQPPTGLTTFEVLPGSGLQGISPSRLTNPGAADDQPIALVQITAGQQLPTAIVDLRTWASKLITAKSVLALLGDAPYGSEANVGTVRYRRALDATQTLVWAAVDDKVSGRRYTASGSYVGTPNGAGMVNISYGVAFASGSVNVVATCGAAPAFVCAQGSTGTLAFDVFLCDMAGAAITSSLRRVNWTATGVLA